MILVVDCKDSFVHNLVAMLRSMDGDVVVMDEEDPRILNMDPDSIVLSPGPGHPTPDRGSWRVFERFHGKVPILGVCSDIRPYAPLWAEWCPEVRNPSTGRL